MSFLTFHNVVNIYREALPKDKRTSYINEDLNLCFGSKTFKFKRSTIDRIYEYKALIEKGEAATPSSYAKTPDRLDFKKISDKCDEIMGNPDSPRVKNAYEKLISLVENSENLSPLYKKDYQNRKTYPTFGSLCIPLIDLSLRDNKNLCTNFKDEIIAEYKAELAKKQKQKEQDSIPPQFVDTLLKISHAMYEDICQKYSRYHWPVDEKLTHNISLPVYGNSNDEKRPLDEFFQKYKENNILTKGEGGIGKTTYLVSLLEKSLKDKTQEYIPFYIPLVSLKNHGKEGDDQYILKYIQDFAAKKAVEGKDIPKTVNSISFIETLHRALKGELKTPKILLLLDGINEITLENDTRIRENISDNLFHLSTYDNTRIIVTTRAIPEVENDDNTIIHKQLTVKATGIPISEVMRILSELNIENLDDNVISILTVPLFFIMFMEIVNNPDSDIKSLGTRGSILYQYYNGTSNIYNEENLWAQNKKIDSFTPVFSPILNDFLFPAIAFKMISNNSEEIPFESLKILCKNLLNLCEPLAGKVSTYSRYNSRPFYDVEAFIERINHTYDIKSEILDRYNTLYENINNNYSFTHQYIRDYFISIFVLNALMLDPIDATSNAFYKQILFYGIPNESIELMGDIILSNPSLGFTVDRMLFLAKEYSRLENHNIIVITLMKLIYILCNKDLSDLVFEDIDLSDFPFLEKRFTRFDADGNFHHAAFKKCTLSPYSLQGYSNFIDRYSEYTFVSGRPYMATLLRVGNDFNYTLLDLPSNTTTANYIISTDNPDIVSPYIHKLIVSYNGKHIALLVESYNNQYLLLYKLSGSSGTYAPISSLKFEEYDDIVFGFTKSGKVYKITQNNTFSLFDWDTQHWSKKKQITKSYDMSKYSISDQRIECINDDQFIFLSSRHDNIEPGSSSNTYTLNYFIDLYMVDIKHKSIEKINSPNPSYKVDYETRFAPITSSNDSLYIYLDKELYQFDLLTYSWKKYNNVIKSSAIKSIVLLDNYIFFYGLPLLKGYDLINERMIENPLNLTLKHSFMTHILSTDGTSSIISSLDFVNPTVLITKPIERYLLTYTDTRRSRKLAFFVGNKIVQIFEQGFIALINKSLQLEYTCAHTNEAFIHASFNYNRNILSIVSESINKPIKNRFLNLYNVTDKILPIPHSLCDIYINATSFSEDGRYMFIASRSDLIVLDLNTNKLCTFNNCLPDLQYDKSIYTDSNAFIIKYFMENQDIYSVCIPNYSEKKGLTIISYELREYKYDKIKSLVKITPTTSDEVYKLVPSDEAFNLSTISANIWIKHNNDSVCKLDKTKYKKALMNYLYIIVPKTSDRQDIMLSNNDPNIRFVSWGKDIDFYDRIHEESPYKKTQSSNDGYACVIDHILYATNYMQGISITSVGNRTFTNTTKYAPGIDIAGCTFDNCNIDAESEKILIFQNAHVNPHTPSEEIFMDL